MTRRSERAPKLAGTGGADGAAPVDFVLLAGLLTLLFLMIVQLGVALHVRNVLASAAAEGARYGANADLSDHTGAAADQTRQIITTELAARFATNIHASVVSVDGVQAVEVEVTAPLPLIGTWGASRVVHVRGHAIEEGG